MLSSIVLKVLDFSEIKSACVSKNNCRLTVLLFSKIINYPKLLKYLLFYILVATGMTGSIDFISPITVSAQLTIIQPKTENSAVRFEIL